VGALWKRRAERTGNTGSGEDQTGIRWTRADAGASGEIAITGHTRALSNSIRNFRENRIAFDGRWDIVVGAWIEAVVQHQEAASPYHYTKMLTLGLDYTFGIGNGAYLLGEHMINQLSNEFSESEYKTPNCPR